MIIKSGYFIHHSAFKSMLSNFERIVVVGPHRSGSKIVANIMSYELDYSFVIEDLMPANKEGIGKFNSEKNIVLHNLLYINNLKDIEGEKTAIIFVHRNADDIASSMKKHNVSYKENIVDIQNKWNFAIKNGLISAFNVDYDSALLGHKLWVDKDKRTNFGIMQVDTHGSDYICTNVKKYLKGINIVNNYLEFADF